MNILHPGLLAARLLAGLLLASSGFAVAAGELPARDDYAYGFELRTTGDSGFFSMASFTTSQEGVIP